MKSTYLEAKNIINGKPFDEIVNLPKIDERFSYGALNGSEGEGLVDLNFKDILVTVRNNNGVATIVSYEQYDANGQFTDLVHTNESKSMKQNKKKLTESQLKKIIAESVKNVLKEWDGYHKRDNSRENIINIPQHPEDNVTPGDSLPIVSTEPRDKNRTIWDDREFFGGKKQVKLTQLRHSINNILTNLEANGQPYRLASVAKDLAERYGFQEGYVLDTLKKAYRHSECHNAIDESKTNKNMKKNVIKLNEVQLRKVVAESVQKVLSELDWKTYQNAANKANKRMDKRFNKFMSASDKAFNDKYGYNPDAAYKEPTVRKQDWNLVGVNDDDRELRRMYDYDSETDTYTNPRNYDATKALGILDKYDDEKRYKRYHNPSLKRFFDNPEQEKAYSKASKEMDDYRLGKYDYDSENGWHLKESKLNAIVAESIKKVLANLNK